MIEPGRTSVARQSLAARFKLPYEETMQDWEWEVADVSRFQEFLSVYLQADLSESERICLMEILIQCVDDLLSESIAPSPENLSEWQALTPLLREKAELPCGSHGILVLF